MSSRQWRAVAIAISTTRSSGQRRTPFTSCDGDELHVLSPSPQPLFCCRAVGLRLLVNLAILSLVGCGGSSNDSQTPSAISDLAGRAVNDSTIVLTWSAPGVGRRSTVSGYDIRYSETAAGLDSAERYVRWPFFGRPSPPGSMDSVTVAGLKRGNPYFFRAWGLASDGEPGEDGNIAEVSTLPDTIPPGRITDLAITGRSADHLTLTWTAPGDDGDRGRATSYRIAIEPGAHETVNMAQATIQTPSERPYLAGVQQQATVLNLSPRASYTLVVLARDEVGQESPPSNVAVGTTDRLPQDWYVYVDGSGDAPTIQAAIDSTRDGEIVWIGPGTYRENLRILDQPEDLRSLDGPEATIIDGSTKAASAIEIRRTLRDTTRVTGLTITGGCGSYRDERPDSYPAGGGVFAQDSHLAIVESHVDANGRNSSSPQRPAYGGGIYFEKRVLTATPRLLLDRCSIQGNVAYTNGGGVGVVGGATIQVNACDVMSNVTPGGDGGGLWLINLIGASTITRCVIDHNEAQDHGGGLYAGADRDDTSLTMVDCVISSNKALQAKDFRTEEVGAGIWLHSLTGRIEQCTVVANLGPLDLSERGGGLALRHTRDFLVSRSLFAYARNNSAIAAFGTIRTTLDTILFWGNEANDVVTGDASLISRNLLQADPLFCDTTSGAWAVEEGSPSLQFSTGRIGAPTSVGCRRCIHADPLAPRGPHHQRRTRP